MSNTKLEVPLNNSLRRDTHLNTVIPKLNRTIALLSKIQHYISVFLKTFTIHFLTCTKHMPVWFGGNPNMIKFFFKVKEPLGHSMVVFQCQVKNFWFHSNFHHWYNSFRKNNPENSNVYSIFSLWYFFWFFWGFLEKFFGNRSFEKVWPSLLTYVLNSMLSVSMDVRFTCLVVWKIKL